MSIRKASDGTYWHIGEDGTARQVKESPAVIKIYESTLASDKQEPGGGRSANVPAIVKKREDAEVDLMSNASELERARIEDIRDMSSMEQGLISAGRETDKLLAGGGNILDFIASPFDSGAIDRTAARIKEQSQKDKAYELFDQEAGGLSTAAGAMVPYMLTGRAIDPISRKVVGSAMKGAGQVAGKVGEATRKGVTTPIRRRAAMYDKSKIDPVGQISEELTEAVIKPINQAVKTYKARPKIKSAFRENLGQDVMSSGFTGGVEGALHYDTDMEQGLLNSVGGTLAGRSVSPLVSYAPNRNTQYVNQIVDKASKEGYRALPGIRTGLGKYQRFESDLRTDDSFTDYMAEIDNANQEFLNRKAGKAMGIEEDFSDITPAKLSEHKRNLKQEFEDIEGRTNFEMNIDDLAEIESGMNRLSKTDKNAIKPIVNDLIDLETVGGKDYKQIRSRLRDALATAQKQGYVERQAVLKDALARLDNNMGANIDEIAGAATTAEWRDLRERYAMTELMLNKGMTPLNEIDTTKLSSHLMADNPERFLTESGGRVRELQDIIRINEIQKQTKGGGLNRLSIHEGEAPRQGFISTPLSLLIPLYSRMKAGVYTNQYYSPAVQGILGMKLTNPYWNPQEILRARAQSGYGYGDVKEDVEEGAEKLEGFYNWGSGLFD